MKIPRARRIGSPIAISTKTHDRVVKVGLALLRLSQNSKTVPKKFEKHHQNTFDENQNAPYRKYGSRFFRQKRAGGSFETISEGPPYLILGCERLYLFSSQRF